MTTLVPACGRDYTNAKDVKADWNANKDFIIDNLLDKDYGSAVNKEQVPNRSFVIRYNRLRNLVCVKG